MPNVLDEFQFAELQVLAATPEGVAPFLAHFKLIHPGDVASVAGIYAILRGVTQNIALIPGRLPAGALFALEQISDEDKPGDGVYCSHSVILTSFQGEAPSANNWLEAALQYVPLGGGYLPVMFAGWGVRVSRELRNWSAASALVEPFGVSLPDDLRSLPYYGNEPGPSDQTVAFILRKTQQNGIVPFGFRRR